MKQLIYMVHFQIELDFKNNFCTKFEILNCLYLIFILVSVMASLYEKLEGRKWIEYV